MVGVQVCPRVFVPAPRRGIMTLQSPHSASVSGFHSPGKGVAGIRVFALQEKGRKQSGINYMSHSFEAHGFSALVSTGATVMRTAPCGI